GSGIVLLQGGSYSVSGTVLRGDPRERELGFPTAHVEVRDEQLLPKQGECVVAIRVREAIYKGMASFGVNPTFKDARTNPLLETYIFDFTDEIYEESVEVYFHQFIREEKKFAGKEEIIAALERDERKVKDYFNK